MTTYSHRAVREEMIFHLSMKEGLSEVNQPERWAKAAGAARGLRMVNGLFNSDPDDAETLIKSRWEESVEAVGTEHPPIDCNDPEMRKHLNHGYLFGIARAWAIVVHDQPHLGELYGKNRETTESFKCPRNQSVTDASNVSTRA